MLSGSCLLLEVRYLVCLLHGESTISMAQQVKGKSKILLSRSERCPGPSGGELEASADTACLPCGHPDFVDAVAITVAFAVAIAVSPVTPSTVAIAVEIAGLSVAPSTVSSLSLVNVQSVNIDELLENFIHSRPLCVFRLPALV